MSTSQPELRLNYSANCGVLIIGVGEREFAVPVTEILRAVSKDPDHFRSYTHDILKPMYPQIDLDHLRYDIISKLDLKDKVVLDIGGHDGRYAKAALNRGAKRAICLDNHQWEHYYPDRAIYEGVEYIQMDAMNWQEPVDVVFLFNVLYHIKNFWAFMDHLRAITREEMLLMSLFRYAHGPSFYLYKPTEYNGADETCYWGISLDGLELLMDYTGWSYQIQATMLDRVLYRCRPTPGFVRKHEDT